MADPLIEECDDPDRTAVDQDSKPQPGAEHTGPASPLVIAVREGGRINDLDPSEAIGKFEECLLRCLGD